MHILHVHVIGSNCVGHGIGGQGLSGKGERQINPNDTCRAAQSFTASCGPPWYQQEEGKGVSLLILGCKA